MSEPTKRTTDQVDDRDDRSCVRCGVSLQATSGSRHHRKPRAIGGHGVQNLILLCGSGTTGCHGWVHSHPAQANAAGYIIPGNNRARPCDLPVFVRSLRPENYMPMVWVLLTDEGDRLPIHESLALELLGTFGLAA